MPEALRTLVGGLAHELNNMLYVIQGYSDMLHEDLAGHPQHQALAAEIRTANRRAQTIAGALGDLAEAPAGGDCAAPYALLKEFAKRRLPGLPPGMALRHSCIEELPPFRVDAAAFHALLECLLQEGLAFLAAKEGAIEMRLERREEHAGPPCLSMRAGPAPHTREEGVTDQQESWSPAAEGIATTAQAAGVIAEACTQGSSLVVRLVFDSGSTPP